MRIHVSGRVQDVNFRYSAKELARKLKLTGYAKNLDDGRVEFVVEGEDEQVFEFLKWSKKGPPFARVENVDFLENDGPPEFKSFEIIY